MRRDSGCAVEVRCLLLGDRRPLRPLYSLVGAPTAILRAGNECFHALALHSFVGAPSAEPQGWQTTSGEAMILLCAVRFAMGLANCSKSFVWGPGDGAKSEEGGKRPTTNVPIVSLQFWQDEAGAKRLVSYRR